MEAQYFILETENHIFPLHSSLVCKDGYGRKKKKNKASCFK